MTTKLTPATARELTAGHTLWDEQVTGLHLRATPTGKSWLLYYRTRDGKERRPKLGAFPEMSLSSAREAAKTIKEKVATGADPSGEWKLGRAAPTVRDLCNRYLNEYAPTKLAAGEIGETHVANNRQLIEYYIQPGLGHMRVAEVTQQDVNAFLNDVYNRKFTTTKTGRHKQAKTPFVARACRAMLGHLFTVARVHFHWAILKVDGAPLNPVTGTICHQVRKRRRKVEHAELRAIALALRDEALKHPAHVACIWTILLTGSRVNEIVMARKQERRGNFIVKHDHKTARVTGDDRVIPLPAPAVALLETFQVDDRTDRLFGEIAMQKVWGKIRKAAGCPDIQLRDLRRTFASYALDAGSTLDQIGQVLGHTTSATTRGYSWLSDQVRASVASQAADRILSIADLSNEQFAAELG